MFPKNMGNTIYGNKKIAECRKMFADLIAIERLQVCFGCFDMLLGQRNQLLVAA